MPACSVVTVRNADAIADCLSAGFFKLPACIGLRLALSIGRVHADRHPLPPCFNRPLTIGIYGSVNIWRVCALEAVG